MEYLDDICKKDYRALSNEELAGLRRVMEEYTDAEGYLHGSQQEIVHVAFMMYMSALTSQDVRKGFRHVMRPVLNIILKDTDFERKIRSKRKIIIVDESSSTAISMAVTELVVKSFGGNVENATTFNITQRTESAAKLSMIDEVITTGIWAGEDLNRLFGGSFMLGDRGVKRLIRYRELMDRLLAEAEEASPEDFHQSEALRARLYLSIDEAIGRYSDIFAKVDQVRTRAHSSREIKRQIMIAAIRWGDPVRDIFADNYLACITPFEAHFVGRDQILDILIRVSEGKFVEEGAFDLIRKLDRRVRRADQAAELAKLVKSVETTARDAAFSLDAFLSEPIKDRVERYLSGSIGFDRMQTEFYSLYKPGKGDRLPYQAKEITMNTDNDPGQDISPATILLSDLLYTQLNENRAYEIRYDTHRLNQYQVEIIEEYIKLLKARSLNPGNIRSRPFSSSHGSEESLIAVYCTGTGFKGEGHVDISVPEGEVTDYILRITGMINIALASSNIPENLSEQDVDKYRPILSYISNQYEVISGESFAIPDSPEDILKAIRRIVIALPKAMRKDVRQIEEYDRSAKQALAAA
jgi:hypothetical protein